MQLSQLFRRGVVVPLTDRCAEQLSRWSVDDFATVQLVSIADESLFEAIWRAGVFQCLNAACSIVIDEYEEEELRPEVIQRAITALTAGQREIKDPPVRLFVESLVALCRCALENHRAVYFVL